MAEPARARRRRGVAYALAALGVLACSDPPAPEPPPPPRPAPVAPVATPRRIGVEGGFDLVATPDGALLAWGPPATDGGGVRVIGLSPLGVLVAGERDISAGSRVAPRAADQAPTQALELVALVSGSALAVAWVAANVPEHVAEASVSSGGVEGFGPAFALGDTATVVDLASARGRLAAQESADGLYLRLRMPSRPCRPDAERCEGTRRVRLDAAARRAALEGPSDEAVPDACEPFLVGAVGSAGTYFHAFCHRVEGAPSALVWALDPEPMLAAAVDPLPGCAPLALAPTTTGAAIVARCPDVGVSVAWLDEGGRVEGVARPALRESTCTAGRPTLRVLGADGAVLEVPLTGRVSRIEGLLDASVAGPRARAVWTGSALLVAEPERGEVALERWECPPFPGAALRRSDD